jgi:hypothetical protein
MQPQYYRCSCIRRRCAHTHITSLNATHTMLADSTEPRVRSCHAHTHHRGHCAHTGTGCRTQLAARSRPRKYAPPPPPLPRMRAVSPISDRGHPTYARYRVMTPRSTCGECVWQKRLRFIISMVRANSPLLRTACSADPARRKLHCYWRCGVPNRPKQQRQPDNRCAAAAAAVAGVGRRWQARTPAQRTQRRRRRRPRTLGCLARLCEGWVLLWPRRGRQPPLRRRRQRGNPVCSGKSHTRPSSRGSGVRGRR